MGNVYYETQMFSTLKASVFDWSNCTFDKSSLTCFSCWFILSWHRSVVKSRWVNMQCKINKNESLSPSLLT